ncbi:MAG: tRNA (adenosine(37)-N6)-threonylcarbamoyltransferase complex dimerization subunit type 1 TsaB [Pseudomonadota bacterium]|nr:MAG: tRNA (adenosine(37)-N6)-threonylcarbamoyltransferase complex dimerization subunit type 1 TsaB [Pseudomonadota bacterium]
MITLALDSATDFCSAALQVDRQTRVREGAVPRRHAAVVVPWIRELLAQAGIGFSALDALAVTRGPGGFTSLRIGLGVMQGIALAHDLPIHPVSTLAALAEAADPHRRARRLLAVLDARMGEVYAGWYRTDGRTRRLIGREAVISPRALSPPDEGPWLVVGSGLKVGPTAISDALGVGLGAVRPESHPHARALLALAGEVEAVDAGHLQPVYLRDRVTG